MFQGASRLRQHAESLSSPLGFRDLRGYLPAQGMPTNVLMTGLYRPVQVTIAMTPAAPEKATPFVLQPPR